MIPYQEDIELYEALAAVKGGREFSTVISSASPENERYLWRQLEGARRERERARAALRQIREGIANEEENGLWDADIILSIIDQALALPCVQDLPNEMVVILEKLERDRDAYKAQRDRLADVMRVIIGRTRMYIINKGAFIQEFEFNEMSQALAAGKGGSHE